MVTKEEIEAKLESCRRCKDWAENKERVRLMVLLESAVDKMNAALAGPDFKPNLGDYMKLVQMEKEMEETSDAGKEIKVTWVEPTDTENAE
jgi:hypothetical protein